MIDFHTHILPGMDDGSQATHESLQMLTLESEQGTTSTTPDWWMIFSASAPITNSSGWTAA